MTPRPGRTTLVPVPVPVPLPSVVPARLVPHPGLVPIQVHALVVVALSLLAAAAAPAALAAEPPPAAAASPRWIARLDLALYGRGGAKGGGGTPVRTNASTASFGSTAGIAGAVELRVAGPVWVEARASAFPTKLEVVRGHGLGEPLEAYESSASTTSWSVGLDLRPARWEVAPGLQISVFARYVAARFGRPPAAAGVTMERRAGGVNGGVRADLRLHGSPWMIGMDLSFGGASPELSDPSNGTTATVETADVDLSIGVRRSFGGENAPRSR